VVTQGWLKAFLTTPDVPDRTKVIFVSAALMNLNSGVRTREVAKLFDVKPDTVSAAVDTVTDAGWFLQAANRSTIEGELTQPEVKAFIPRKKLELKARVTKYENHGVRDWNSKDFIDFFIDKWLEIHDEELLETPGMKRGLIKGGVNVLAGMAGVSTHPRVLYRQYLIWAIPKFDGAKVKLLRDKKFFRWFLDNQQDR